MANSPIHHYCMSRIMKRAWSEYRFQLNWAGGDEKSPALWSKCLKGAWLAEKGHIALEIERDRRELLAQVDPEASRLETIKQEIENLKYCDGPIAQRQAALREELIALQSAIVVNSERRIAA